MINTEKAARKIAGQIEAHFKPRHEFIEVSEHDFSHLDMSFYNNTRSILEEKGFRYIRDIEDVTLANADKNLDRVMIRTMLSKDGNIMAGIYHPKLKKSRFLFSVWLFFQRKLPGRIVDFESEFSDSVFILTSTAKNDFDMPPGVLGEFYPGKISVSQLYQRHLERIEKYKTDNPGVNLVPKKKLGDILESQNRINSIAAEFRKEILITREEIQRLGGLPRSVTDEIYKEIEKIRMNNRNTGRTS